SAQPIVDESATPEQRTAILRIMKGEETEPGATIFYVFDAMTAKRHAPLFLPIDFDADIEERVGHVCVRVVLEITGEPIRNPVTGKAHRVRIDIPHGFEYPLAEIAAATTKTYKGSKVPLAWTGAHAHFVDLHWTRNGVVR